MNNNDDNKMIAASLLRLCGGQQEPAAVLRLHGPMGSYPDALWTPPNSLILSLLSRTLRIQIPDHISNHLITSTSSLMSIADHVITYLAKAIYFGNNKKTTPWALGPTLAIPGGRRG